MSRRQVLTLAFLAFSFATSGQAHPQAMISAGSARSQSTVSSLATESAASVAPPSPIIREGGSPQDQPGRTIRKLTLVVGRSLFIDTPTRLRRVYVSNPTVLDSFPSSPKQVVATAKAPGISSLIIWDETGRSDAYLVSANMDIAGLEQALESALPHDSIRVTANEDRISLSGSVLNRASVETATTLASLYSKDVINSITVQPPHTKQVQLKVQMIEVDRSKLDQFGINLFKSGATTIATSTGQFSPPSTTAASSGSGSPSPSPLLTVGSPLNFLFYNSSSNLGLTLQDLQNKQVLEILAEPTITTRSGEKASFLSGGEFPFPVVQGSSVGLTSITIEFRPYGVRLDFTPQVTSDNTIVLKVAPEVSALDYTNAVNISGYSVPAISTRRADTQIELRDGQSFAISGLLDRRVTDMFNKMPGIGDVPLLGQLFRSKSTTHSVVELVVIVTPTIVDPLAEVNPPHSPTLPVPPLDANRFDHTLEGKHSGRAPATMPSTTEVQP